MKNVILEDVDFKLLDGFSESAVGKYTEYLKEHIENVHKYFELIKPILGPDFFSNLDISMEELEQQLRAHDGSKWSVEEFLPYANHFYGENDEDAFNIAVGHHFNNNPHHPEYWGSAVKMPMSCIIEMICDWGSFSLKGNDLNNIFKWWNDNKEEKSKVMHPETIRKAEEILTILKNTFNKANEDEYLTEAVLIKPRDVIATA